jgi:hypothetical protein
MVVKRKQGRPKFKGCNEDCFNCKYSDCKKPVHQLKQDNSIFNAIRIKGNQEKRYTVSLGGYGNPNKW